jgi:hypothetical protein
VEKLRRENADSRTKLRAAEEELDKRRKAEMDDLTRAQTERDEEKVKREEAERQLATMRLQIELSTAATAASFYDPQDAVTMIAPSEIRLNDDGTPNKQSVEAAVKRLMDSKPHLVRGKAPGSGDGGARGKGAATVEDRQAALVAGFQQKGGVPKP